MKQLYRVIILLTLLALLLTANTAGASADKKNDLRGLWVATVVNIDYPVKPSTDPEVLKSEADKILNYAKATGLNAVFLQVRPTADALYKSSFFPWSKYLTGRQGLAPSRDFDPLKYWITEAHSRGLELHAWINPYRVTKKTSAEKSTGISSLSSNHPARLHPDWVVNYSDGNLYFNPGIPEVRKLIVDSILELIGNYDVDGIHFDDYFYPGRSFNDSSTFAKYGKGYSDIGNWRRANVNTLVSDVSKAIRASGKNIRFGISPFGIWANRSSNTLGSETKGLESYYDHYADSRKWVKEGVIDYIAPQLYWNIGYSSADYSKLLNWWKSTVSGTSVDLYIGQAAYRAGSSDRSSPWYGTAEMERQLHLNEATPEVKGSIFFNYTSLVTNPGLGSVLKTIFEKRDGLSTENPVTVSRPSSNIRTGYSSYYLNGTSDPSKPLYLNGKPVTGRSAKGYFGILCPLQRGSNTLTLSQEGSYVTRVIYRTSAVQSQASMSRIEIPSSSVFPQSQEYRRPGEKITLSCQAPAGSKVAVKIGGRTYTMSTSSGKSASGLYPANYTYTYRIPSYNGAPRNIDLGAPVYSLSCKGIKKTCTAPAKVGVIMEGSPFYAEVSRDVIDTFAVPNASKGAAYELTNGMVDYVTGMTGSYARLSSGLWVRKTSISVYSSKARLQPAVTGIQYNAGEKWDSLKFSYPSSLAAIASFNGSTVTLNISAAVSGVLPELPQNSLFASASFKRTENSGQYSLTLKPEQKIGGYYIEKTSDGIILFVKHPVKAASEGSLHGITIMLDPGHGGSESGAIGPLGTRYSEKTINLNTALKLKSELEALGATVRMTRVSDVTVSLAARLDASRKLKPDMFLSIHANSMEDNVDISKIQGFSAHYKEALAKPLSEVLVAAASEAGRRNRGISYDNFYVVRGTWTPSMLIETGFVPNPSEFELLTGDSDQGKLAKSIAASIAQYFTE